jgi:acetamidase/formamidase
MPTPRNLYIEVQSGSTLVVTIVDIALDDFGYTAIAARFGLLREVFRYPTLHTGKSTARSVREGPASIYA